MDFVFEVDKALYFWAMRVSKILRTGIMPSPTLTWLSFSVKLARSFMWTLWRPRACFVDGLNNIGAGTNGVADVDAAPDARSKFFTAFNTSSGECQILFPAVIVDGEADVVLLHEFFNARQSFRCGVAGDNDGIPARLQYSNLARMSASSSLGK